MLILWNRNLLTIDAGSKLRAYKTSYFFNGQYYLAVMFFVVVKMVHPCIRNGCYDIKKLDTMNMYRFKHNLPKTNL